MDYLYPFNNLLGMKSSDVLWWSIILVPPLVWIFQSLNVSVLLYILGAIASAAFGSLSWISLRLYSSPKFKVNENSLGLPKHIADFQRSIIEDIINSRLDQSCHLEECKENEDGTECSLSSGAPIVSRNIDHEINEIIDSIFNYYIGSWMEDLLFDGKQERNNCTCKDGISSSSPCSGCNKFQLNDSLEELHKIFRHDSWFVIRNVCERLKGVDWVKFLSYDLVKKVTEHLEKIRVTSDANGSSTGSAAVGNTDPLGKIFTSNTDQNVDPPMFYVKPFLMEVGKELQHLSKISELAILLLTPVSYSACHITRQILKEILSKHVIFKLIEMITDPDYINQKILTLIHKTQQDQKDQRDVKLGGNVMDLSDTLNTETTPCNDTILSSHPKPPLGRFDSAESETGTSSVTFQNFFSLFFKQEVTLLEDKSFIMNRI